jgi:iron-regulated transporter 1
MVPTIEITRPSRSDAPEEAGWTRPGQEVNDASDGDAEEDWDGEGKRDSEETIDDLESSISGLSSEASVVGKTSWEERLKWWKVYALHFLFMWNSGTFEYVSVRHSESLNCLKANWEDISRCFGFP